MEFLDRVYRISNSKHSNDLSGEGAFLFGGRWNSPGVRVLYTSTSISLSILEVLVYVSNRTLGEKDISVINISSASVRKISLDQLDEEWKEVPASPYTQLIGDKWVKSKESLLLIVPSVINPFENNVLINPSHPDFDKVKISEIFNFSFDRRLV